nr:hypothetical protein [Flavobacterium sp. ASV13]
MAKESQMLMNRKIVIITFCFLVISGCQNNNKYSNTEEPKTKIDSLLIMKSDSNLFSQKNSLKVLQLKEVAPDTAVNNRLFLENYNSVSNFYFGDSNFVVIDNGTREAPFVVFKNKDYTQYLLAYQYEGGTKNAFDCFEIGYFENDKKLLQNSTYNVDDKIFETESKLSLGTSLEKLIEVKGDGYITKKDNDKLIVTYRIDNYDKSSFLKRYNMPGYFMEFTLKDNIVTKILFGFDYP